jgi:hypothetical protein
MSKLHFSALFQKKLGTKAQESQAKLIHKHREQSINNVVVIASPEARAKIVGSAKPKTS